MNMIFFHSVPDPPCYQVSLRPNLELEHITFVTRAVGVIDLVNNYHVKSGHAHLKGVHKQQLIHRVTLQEA